ncbi:MAG: carboxylesterase family protein, partial [Pseudomonadota bacterium]
MKIFLRILAILGVLTLLIILAAVGLYFYLAPAAPPERVTDESTIRQLDSGKVIGFVEDGTDVWLGIPYAAPPVDDLRWRAPQPVSRWIETREALTFGNECPQRSGGGVSGNEDCLFVNVWAPAGNNKELPVMFWIHGGGNSVGTSSTYNGATLSKENELIIVSLNYRLGPLGWFKHSSLADETTTPADNSGNYGTLDIIMALQWVQQNIGTFGGDPNNVTIFGESAGGFDVLTMMASPLATGLFHRAISQSGGLDLTELSEAENYTDEELPGHRLSAKEIVNNMLINQGAVADRDAAKQHQDNMMPADIAKALRALTPEELLGFYSGGFGGMIGNPDIFADGHVLPVGLTTTDIFSNTSTYTHNAVPVMLGTNRDESKLFMAFSDNYVSKTFGMPSGFKNLAAYNRDSGYSSDSWKIRAVDALADAMQASGNNQVYTYRFDVDDWRSLGFISFKDLLGAAHALEIPFVFGNFPKPLRLIFPGSMQDEFNDISAQMRSYWAAFAYHGTPGKGQNNAQVEWQSWDSS